MDSLTQDMILSKPSNGGYWWEGPLQIFAPPANFVFLLYKINPQLVLDFKKKFRAVSADLRFFRHKKWEEIDLRPKIQKFVSYEN